MYGLGLYFLLLHTRQFFLTYFVMSPCRVWPALVLLLFHSTVAAEESSLLEGWHDVWLFRFLINMLGYSTIIIPGYFLIRHFKRTNYLETGLDSGLLTSALEMFGSLRTCCRRHFPIALVSDSLINFYVCLPFFCRWWDLLPCHKDLCVWQ